MSRLRTRRVLVAVAALSAALGVALVPMARVGAQEGQAIEVTGIDLTAFPEVTLRFAAPTAQSGTLTAEQVEITENDEPVQFAFSGLADQTVGVVLALDTSGSIRDAMGQAKQAAKDLIGTLPGSASVAVVGFGTQAALVQPFTTDRAQLGASIDGLTAQGGTALYDAIGVAGAQAAASSADRTALVVLSDGADSDSGSTAAQAAASLVGTVDDFYLVSLQTGETDSDALEDLAEAAEGRVVSAADPAALAAAYVDLGRRIVNQYQVTFTSVTEEATSTFAVSVPSLDAAGSVEVALPGRTGSPTTAPSTDGRKLPEPVLGTADPTILESKAAMFVGAALVAAAIAWILTIIVPNPGRPRERRRRLGSDAEVIEGNAAERALAQVRGAATRLSTRAVERADATGGIDKALDRAGLIMRAGEFAAAVVAVSLGAAVLLFLFMGPIGAVIGLVVPILGSGTFLKFMASRRNAKFADQLSDTLLIMSGSLRSGFGVGQAIDTVAEEMDAPMATEFQRAILETRLGRNIEDALQSVAARVQNEDFEWVVDAMRINKQVGGELAEILEQVSETIRARNRLKRQVSALTAEGRISAYVLGALPILIGLFLFSSNPDYMQPLFDRTIGWVMLGVSGGLLIIGALWLRKLIDIEY